MASSLISLGIGSPATIPFFILVGLHPTGVVAAAAGTRGRLPIQIPLTKPGQSAVDILEQLFPRVVVIEVPEPIDLRPVAEIISLEVRTLGTSTLHTQAQARAVGATLVHAEPSLLHLRDHADPTTYTEEVVASMLRYHDIALIHDRLNALEQRDDEALSILGITL